MRTTILDMKIFLKFLLILAVSLVVVLCQNATVEIVNIGEETLLVKMKTRELFILLPAGEKYIVTETDNHFQDDIWAYPAKCQNELCDYKATYAEILMLKLNDNITETITSYNFVEGPYNRPMTIESLDQPDCPIASCQIDLVEDCPETSKIKDDDGNVVACFFYIGDIEIFNSLCPNATDHLTSPKFAFTCNGSRELRVSIK